MIVQEAVLGTSLGYLPIKAANSLFIDVSDQAPLIFAQDAKRKILDALLMLILPLEYPQYATI